MMSELRMRAKYVTIEHASGRGVAERWRSQYQKSDGWTNTVSGSSKETYDRLCELGETPDIAAVAAVIGNKGWSYLRCDGCGEYTERAVRIGDAYSEGGNLFCQVCVAEASAILRAQVERVVSEAEGR